MSLRRADARFLLPRAPRTAALLGDLDEWRAALEAAGIEAAPAERAELVVAAPSHHRDAVRLHRPAAILEGGNPHSRGATHSYAALPGRDQPELIIPLGSRAPIRYALEEWAVPRSRWKHLRNDALAALLGAGIVPHGLTRLTLTGEGDTTPFLVRAARERGVDVRDWLAAFPGLDAFSRGVIFLFSDGREPKHVLKFARMPGYDDVFERDERGLAIAARAGDLVRAHIPKHVARFEVDGIFASIETSARGMRLTAFLQSPRPHSAKLTAIASVVDWLVACAVATRSASGVLCHGDFGTWNVFVHDGGFTVLDWEDARESGPPLWDLLYFLSDAAAHLDGIDDAHRSEHFAELWRGERRTSDVAFAAVRRYVDAIGLPHASVGPLATELWVSIGTSHVDRRELAVRHGQEQGAVPPAELYAETWLRDPVLGRSWSRWLAD